MVAIDVGGTNLKGAAVDRRGRALSARRMPTRASDGPETVIDAVLAFAAQLAAGERKPVAVGLAVPGIVQELSGVVVEATNLGWRGVSLRELAEQRLGLAVAVRHDVRAAALAEGVLGAARGCSDYLLLTLGTGVGAAVVLDGEPYTGAHGLGGELGHLAVEPRGPICGCGREGCLEALASAAHIAARYREMSGTDEGPVDAQHVAERAQRGDPIAARVWGAALDALAQAIANYAILLDPELVVIGGGMAAAGERLFGPLLERVRALVRLGDPPPIVPAALEEAGRDGAAIAAWQIAGIEEQDLNQWAQR